MNQMSLLDWLSIILSVAAFTGVLIIIIINLYLKICPRRFIKVNCWFCNQWLKVGVDQQNSWDCPYCEQYNGFAQDGGYNKLIPAQHDEFLNKIPATSRPEIRNNLNENNGLCSACNNNQRLKVQQLAMFSPIEENNFDKEVEQYEKHLDRAYRLCPHCETVVKQTLRKQKSILLGFRLTTIRKQGVDFINRNFSKAHKQNGFLTAIRLLTIFLAFTRIYKIMKTCDFSTEFLNNSLPSAFVPYFILLKDIILISKNTFENILTNYKEIFQSVLTIFTTLLPHISGFYFLHYLKSTLIGAFLQTLLLLFNKNSRRVFEICKLFIWVKFYFDDLENEEWSFEQNDYTLEIVLCLFLILPPISIKFSIPRLLKTRNAAAKTCNDIQKEERTEEFNCQDDQHNVSDLLNSTFKSTYSEKLNRSRETTDNYNKTNSSPNSKMFNSNSNNFNDSSVNLFPSFGQQAIFENPLNNSYLKFSPNHRFSSNKSINSEKQFNGSLNSTFYEDKFNDSFSSESIVTATDVEEKRRENELNKVLNNLHLSPNGNFLSKRTELPASFRRVSSSPTRPKPVLSPPKLLTVTQSSWVAGGYWKPDDFISSNNNFCNLSRSSSQSSGFASLYSGSQNNCDKLVFNSLPSSRASSVCGDIDRFSVLSEPVYPVAHHHGNRFYPIIRPNQQIQIYPKPVYDSNYNNGFAYPTRPCSSNNGGSSSVCSNRERNVFNNFSPYPVYNVNNPFYSYTNLFSNNCTRRPESVNSYRSVFSQPVVPKGSLLKKWRDRSSIN